MSADSPSLFPFLAAACSAVRPLSEAKIHEARKRLDSLTKPVGSLGMLEDLAAQLYAVQEEFPVQAGPARMYTIAADHGVVAEGVASSPKEVTALMVENFLRQGAAINSLCAAAGADFRVVDAGVDAPPFAAHEFLINARIAQGTANMAKGPAMSRTECEKALELGISLAESARADGIRVVGLGEMGIGNTTASSALFCACLGFTPEEMTGMGAGIPPRGLAHKTAVIKKALEVNKQAVDSGDPVAVLAALGGLEIATLAGLVIGAAARRMLVMVDGFIATAALAVAERIVPAARAYCVFCHGSAEAGHGAALARLGVRPLLDIGMRLGEGTGAALGMMLLKGAAETYNRMATFGDAGIAL